MDLTRRKVCLTILLCVGITLLTISFIMFAVVGTQHEYPSVSKCTVISNNVLPVEILCNSTVGVLDSSVSYPLGTQIVATNAHITDTYLIPICMNYDVWTLGMVTQCYSLDSVARLITASVFMFISVVCAFGIVRVCRKKPVNSSFYAID